MTDHDAWSSPDKARTCKSGGDWTCFPESLSVKKELMEAFETCSNPLARDWTGSRSHSYRGLTRNTACSGAIRSKSFMGARQLIEK